MDPRKINIREYSYTLPPGRIAVHPPEKRDGGKLLVYKNGRVSADLFRNLPEHISPGSLMVFNSSKVMAARVIFTKATGGQIEIFILEPDGHHGEISQAMQTTGSIEAWCLVGGASKWKHGLRLEKDMVINGRHLKLYATISHKEENRFRIGFSWTPENIPFAEILDSFGQVPLPPYLHRDPEEEDKIRYQTVYAQKEGSVAAPTAGLHFTPDTLQALAKRQVDILYLTLHVGAGTFKPVTAEKLEGHEMHTEYLECTPHLLEKLLEHEDVAAVGTTSMRCIESLYWLGVKLLNDPGLEAGSLFLSQWELYDEPLSSSAATKEQALNALLNWMEKQSIAHFYTHTALLIVPGYKFRVTRKLVTNFHQPQSTLLLLVAAFAGKNWKEIYDFALENDFRFLSYGDSSLLMPDDQSTTSN